MVLVPLGISINSWTRSIDPKSKNRSTISNSGIFTTESGDNTFHRVKKDSPHSTNPTVNRIKQSIVSPVSQILAQTKEKEKLTDSPENVPISLNMTASSSKVSRVKNRTSVTKGKKKSIPSKQPRNMKGTIKRLQKKRNSQSKRGNEAGKKPASRKKKK